MILFSKELSSTSLDQLHSSTVGFQNAYTFFSRWRLFPRTFGFAASSFAIDFSSITLLHSSTCQTLIPPHVLEDSLCYPVDGFFEGVPTLLERGFAQLLFPRCSFSRARLNCGWRLDRCFFSQRSLGCILNHQATRQWIVVRAHVSASIGSDVNDVPVINQYVIDICFCLMW